MSFLVGRRKFSAPDQVNTFHKIAFPTSSLYQQCTSLRSRLLNIRGFPRYFSMATSADTPEWKDPVTELRDIFLLGISLCYLFDLLPAEQGFTRINYSQFDEEEDFARPDRLRKHAIVLFAIQISSKMVRQIIPQCEPFIVTDLWDADSTHGFIKVVKTVTAIVDHLPKDVFEYPPPSLPPPYQMEAPSDSLSSFLSDLAPENSTTTRKSTRNNIIRTMIKSERKYVQDLEIVQKYCDALAQGNVISQDDIHLLFPNFNNLLNFQRKFLIRLESTAELPWKSQRWGRHFFECEEEFVVYEPYSANYMHAKRLMIAYEQHLSALNNLINVKNELAAFLIMPVFRVRTYALLLKSLISATSEATYRYFHELKQGSEAVKRITERMDEAQRRAENETTARLLRSRVKDWKGYHLSDFGQLLLDDVFEVTKSAIGREYHVFLFEKIILFCKRVPEPPPMNAKSAIRRREQLPPSVAADEPAEEHAPLLLKGRIFIQGVVRVTSVSANPPSKPSPYHPLSVWWKGGDDLNFFTLSCQREDQRKQWQKEIEKQLNSSRPRRRDATSRFDASASMPYDTSPAEPPALSHSEVLPSDITELDPTISQMYVDVQDERDGASINPRTPVVFARLDRFARLPYTGSRNSSEATHHGSSVDGVHVDLVSKVEEILEDPRRYKKLLCVQGSDLARLFSLLRITLSVPMLKPRTHRAILVAMQRLSQKADFHLDEFDITNVDIRVGDDPVAAGGFADIYEGRMSGEDVSVKMIRLYQTSQIDYVMKKFRKEAMLWSQISHPSLLPMYGLYRCRGRVAVISPWMENGNVNEYLARNTNVDCQLLGSDVANGLAYLHLIGIVHGDLKGANILVTQAETACITDFGLSSVSDSQILKWTSQSSAVSSGGTLRWQAPELCDVENDKVVPNTRASDVYAWACVCYEMFTGNIPFFEYHRDSVVLLKILAGERPSRPLPSSPAWIERNMTENVWFLMEECWRKDPAERPTIHDALHKLPVDEGTMRERGEMVKWKPPSWDRAYAVDNLSLRVLESILNDTH